MLPHLLHVIQPQLHRDVDVATEIKHEQDPDLASPKLSLRALLDLAREISASDVVIPASHLALLELSIKQRKLAAAVYFPDANVSENNKAHLHAINAYSQVLQIFKEAEKKGAERGRRYSRYFDARKRRQLRLN